jgi:ribosomal protein S18 acetylase RimI-like enzyme
MKSTLRWLDDQSVEEKYIAVAAGNEKAFKFYERFGFCLRRTVLSQLPKT